MLIINFAKVSNFGKVWRSRIFRISQIFLEILKSKLHSDEELEEVKDNKEYRKKDFR
ncbi:hypothetical protein [Capnocytophaga sp. HP1101]